MILVVCLPHAVAVFTHWKCVTKDGTRYKRIWASAFAAYFCAVFSLSLGIMLGMPCKDHNVRAAIIIFTVCLPMILCFGLHFVVWSSRNVGSPYPQKYVIRFALVFALVFALSLGLVVGLASDPLKLRIGFLLIACLLCSLLSYPVTRLMVLMLEGCRTRLTYNHFV
jgi:hypothetical protein